MLKIDDLDTVQRCLALALRACCAAREYDLAIKSCGGNRRKMDEYCSRVGETLDLLYLRWQQTADEALQASLELTDRI